MMVPFVVRIIISIIMHRVEQIKISSLKIQNAVRNVCGRAQIQLVLIVLVCVRAQFYVDFIRSVAKQVESGK